MRQKAFCSIAALVAIGNWLNVAAQAPIEEDFYFLLGAPPELLMLSQPPVQKELKLTAKQLEQIVQASETQMRALEKLVAERRQDRFGKIHEFLRDSDGLTEEILSEEQAKRLKEITWQARGIQAYVVGGQGKKSSVSDAQKEKFWAIRKEARSQMTAFAALDAPARDKKLTELRKNIDDRVMNLLTAEQKAAWKQLTGAPFAGTLNLGPFGGVRVLSR